MPLPLFLSIRQCVQAGCTRATSAFWLSLHNFANVCRKFPLKGWRVGERPTHTCPVRLRAAAASLSTTATTMVRAAMAPGGNDLHTGGGGSVDTGAH
jgi:hypothetical protein